MKMKKMVVFVCLSMALLVGGPTVQAAGCGESTPLTAEQLDDIRLAEKVFPAWKVYRGILAIWQAFYVDNKENRYNLNINNLFSLLVQRGMVGFGYNQLGEGQQKLIQELLRKPHVLRYLWCRHKEEVFCIIWLARVSDMVPLKGTYFFGGNVNPYGVDELNAALELFEISEIDQLRIDGGYGSEQKHFHGLFFLRRLDEGTAKIWAEILGEILAKLDEGRQRQRKTPTGTAKDGPG